MQDRFYSFAGVIQVQGQFLTAMVQRESRMEDEERLENPEEEPDGKKSRGREAFSTLIYFIVIILLAVLFVTFVAQRTKVSGPSMYPTLEDGDNLIVDKISYHFRDPERFDIIIFPYEDEDEEESYFIKRIIGLPGETVQIDEDGNIYIDGEILEEDYGYEQILNPGIAADPVVLGEDEYFVMGDNRNNSLDSRYPEVGVVEGDTIVGRAWIRIYPFDSIGLVKNIQ